METILRLLRRRRLRLARHECLRPGASHADMGPASTPIGGQLRRKTRQKKKKQLIEVTHRQMWLSASRVPLKAFGLACLKVLAVSIGNKAAVVRHT